MSHRLLSALALSLSAGCVAELPSPTCEPETGLPVFPGAEGFGTSTSAGRGGVVLEVTSLEDSGPGTLRAAVEDPRPRTVVFRTGGDIVLSSELSILNGHLTIAGQTAPGDGILVRGNFTLFAPDILIQYIRIRPGPLEGVDPENNDAIALEAGARNIVIDHVSAGWSEDEILSVVARFDYSTPDDEVAGRITLSNNLIAEALNKSRHQKGGHSAGVLVGFGASCVSMHHNLFAHNGFRNPAITHGGLHEVIENVVYNFQDTGCELSPHGGIIDANIIGNTFLAGADSPAIREIEIVREEVVSHFTDSVAVLSPSEAVHIFATDNQSPHRKGDDEYSMASFGFGDDDVPRELRAAEPFAGAVITRRDDALESVLDDAGASRPRDSIDARVVDGVRNGTGSIIDDVDEVGGYPARDAGVAPDDADHDGMSDAWEADHGHDPAVADGDGDDDADGYTNLEEYLHNLGGL